MGRVVCLYLSCGALCYGLSRGLFVEFMEREFTISDVTVCELFCRFCS